VHEDRGEGFGCAWKQEASGKLACVRRQEGV
jgi:hypothetical protein